MLHILHQYVSVRALVLFAFEACLVAASLVLGARVRFWDNPGEFHLYTGVPLFGLQMLALVAVCQLSFYCNNLYDLNAVRAPAEELILIEQALGAASLFLAVLYFLVPGLLVGRGVFFISIVLAGGLMAVSRPLIHRMWTAAGGRRKILILGTGELARDVAREISCRSGLGCEVAGFAAESESFDSSDLFGRPVLGHISDIQRLVAVQSVSRVIVAIDDRRGALPIRDLVRLRVRGIRIEDVHSVLSALTGRVWLRSVKPSWFIFSDGFTASRLTSFAKRCMDVALAGAGLVLAAPAMCLVALAVRLESRGPVLYRQDRVGRGGQVFEVLKFRSMSLDAEPNGEARWAAKNDPRVTRVGAFIRKYRFDELPQFVNILRGDMSFVGPRPERPVFVQQLRECIPYYDERHSVRPGLTGWAQIRYGYGSNIEDAQRKLEYDLFYLKNMSILFDCLIVFGTIRTVLTGYNAR